MNTIKRLGNGWYSFKEVNQGNNYIKIDALNCGTDKKALKQASKISKEDVQITD